MKNNFAKSDSICLICKNILSALMQNEEFDENLLYAFCDRLEIEFDEKTLGKQRNQLVSFRG